MSLAILLRNGTHAAGEASSASERYILKCDNASIQIAKTPIQIPVPQQSPELFDIGIFRPSITISGIVDSTSNDPSGSAPYMDAQAIDGETYYIPYKNRLEEISMVWLAADDSTIELEMGELDDHDSTATTSSSTPWNTNTDSASGLNHTGGGIYKVAFQQSRFEFSGGEEHFWSFTLQFVSESRSDITFPTS